MDEPLLRQLPAKNGQPLSTQTMGDSDSMVNLPLIGEDMASCCGARIMYRRKDMKIYIGLLSVVGLVVSLATACYVSSRTEWKTSKRNVILLISDGFGPASETLARNFYTHRERLPVGSLLPLDTILVGSSRTRSTSSLVTDSAAGATAFACAKKTYNGAIAVDDKQNPCGTVLEAAKFNGYLTGLVATSRITHATPASFAAHVTHRDFENIIAEHEIGNYTLGRMVDIMMGGGHCHFLPKHQNGSCRLDERHLIQEAVTMGWSVGTTRSEFDAIDPSSVKLPHMHLFTLDHMSYDIDRDPSREPSLKEMAEKTLNVLAQATQNSDKGFFVMIEGSRIDMAGHSNDPAAHVHDILAYQDTIAYVKQFVDQHPGTVMISVSDHETGGISLARQVSLAYPEYRWNPEALVNVKNSTFVLAHALNEVKSKNYTLDRMVQYVKEVIIRDGLGIHDFTEKEVDTLIKSTDPITVLGEMINLRAELGWATHGHSAVDVNLYAYGLHASELIGNHENSDLGDFISNFLGLNLDDITKKLESMPVKDLQSELSDNVVHYHHGPSRI